MKTTYVWYNDSHLLGTYLQYIFFYFSVFVISIICHELGHVLFWWIHKKRKIGFKMHLLWGEVGTLKDYKELSTSEYVKEKWFGVVIGSIPIILFSFYYFPIILMLIPYLASIREDLKEISKYGEGLEE